VPQAGFWRRILLSAATGASPDGAPAAEGALREAVVFERNCGATTDFSTQVSVLPCGARLRNQPGNAFIYGHQVPLSVRWDTPSALWIAYPPGFRGLNEQPAVDGVMVRYAEDESVREK